MIKSYLKYLLVALVVIGIDQYIKYVVVSGFRINGSCISGVLTYNKGVAFSMFAFLDEYLKWIQLTFLIGMMFYVFKYLAHRQYLIPISLIIGAGISNISDRFVYGGVVDYVYWHCGFDFAIFNFADVVIDFGVVIILYIAYQNEKKAK